MCFWNQFGIPACRWVNKKSTIPLKDTEFVYVGMCVYILSMGGGRKRSCQCLVSSAGRPSIRQGLSSFPTVHWPWVPGIDFLWCRTERGRYHMAPAMWCDQEQISEIPMQWWWIASQWGPSILTYRNQVDTCTEFIIIQATDVTKLRDAVTVWNKINFRTGNKIHTHSCAVPAVLPVWP